MGKRLEIAYKIVRALVFLVPAATVAAGLYLVLFPIETFGYLALDPSASKLEISKDLRQNTISFGVFPLWNNRYIDLTMNFDRISEDSCRKAVPKITIEKTFQAFLFPEGEAITSARRLRELVTRGNKTKYPNGSLLHLKPTDEVYIVTDGKKTLFPGPEIFRAFGYSFDNLIDVEKSALDQFPDADNKVFLWTQPHPNGTIFQSFPSHNLYLIADGKKMRLESDALLEEVWPEFHTIAVNDLAPENRLACKTPDGTLAKGKISCRFDARQMPASLGKYFQFTIEAPPECKVEGLKIKNARINFIADKSYGTIKDSLRNIFASILNRYINRQEQQPPNQ